MKPVINAAYCKKLQSQIKSVIQNFGKFMFLWNSDCAQMSGLLAALDTLLSEWMTVISRDDVDGSYRIISGELMLEIEHVLSQLRMFEKRLIDVVSAMSLSIHESFKLIVNEPVEIFPEDCIFTTEHFLEMQDMYQNYALELSRKSELLKNIFSNEVVVHSSLVDTERLLRDVVTELTSREQQYTPHFRICKEGLNKCMEQWSEDSELSLVSTKAVEVFLSKNNLSDGS